MPESTDNQLNLYDYDLPESAIAQEPSDKRDASRLLVLDREKKDNVSTTMQDFPNFLPENALIVANNSRVVPARMFGKRPTGGKVEFLLLTPLPLLEVRQDERGNNTAEASGLLRSSKSPKPGERIAIGTDLHLEIIAKGEFGRSRVRMVWRGDLTPLLEEHGHMPLPPYIRRPDREADRSRYQTIYSREDKAGSVAAPTAGLHFTPELRQRLLEAGHQWEEVTLYVGYGTFSPVRAEDIRNHAMHSEFVEIPERTARAVAKAKQEGRPVVAVGSTSVRALEGAFAATGKIAPFAGETDIFIRPGYEFRVVDHMLTNFHLPLSSLIIMVSAFAGRRRILAAYQQALENGFRFFSYGDAMLII
jgi:S-adenosylmethionine:tRNA ribosyltransferase-isomerase